ncbi:MAG TPA: type II secretion system F family protein, partial [Armatimonadota bacterium]|nr:type II secretion system F family protein [Armatimonadota bacterium]
ETSGDLAGLFEQAARYLDNEHKIRSKISLYTFYPKALLVFALLISTVPTLFLGSLGAWLVEVARLAASVGVPILVLWAAFRIALGYPTIAHGYDRVKLAIPWFGGVIRKFCGARFCRCLGYLYHAGVPIVSATDVGAKSCGNLHMRDRLLGLSPLLQQGAPISDVLARSGQFPPEVIHMAAAGEKSGDLDSLLTKVADYMEEEADTSANKAVLLSLPLSVVLIGFIVVLRLAMGMLMGSEYVKTIQQMTQ